MTQNCSNPLTCLAQKTISKPTSTAYKNGVSTGEWNSISQNVKYCMYQERNSKRQLNMNWKAKGSNQDPYFSIYELQDHSISTDRFSTPTINESQIENRPTDCLLSKPASKRLKATAKSEQKRYYDRSAKALPPFYPNHSLRCIRKGDGR